jgi:hypothetical protein
MVLAIVIIVFALIVLLGLCPAWKNNGKKDNVFYLLCVCISFTILLLRSVETALPDPAKLLVEWFHSIGLER